MASKCRKLSMCKRCNKHHHRLLHWETAPKMEGINKVPKEVTFAASSKGSKEVLLMTCRVEVTAPDSVYTGQSLAGLCSVDLANYGTSR